MAVPAIVAHRLYNQRLEQTNLRTPSEVVAWLGAVQAQEYGPAKWSLALRMADATDAAIERAFTDGDILRTHVMRPTWHFVARADIRWLLALTAPRVNALNAHMYRRLELDEGLLQRGNEAMARALEGGRQLTRAELASALGQAGIVAAGMRLGYIVHRAELDAIICSGARRGKQFTYALLDERAPRARTLPRDEALAELTRRYFTSHGPALAQDLAWWSGLTIADVRAGLEMARPHLVQESVDGKSYWRPASTPSMRDAGLTAYLLPTYDEYTIAYRDRSAYLDPAIAEVARNRDFTSSIVIDGRIVGMWKRTFSRGAVVIELAPFRPFTAAERDGIVAAARRFGEFLGMSVELH